MQRLIANRLGWLRRARRRRRARRPRCARSPGRSRPPDSPTCCCSAWAARASRPRSSRGCSASRPGFPRFRMLDSVDPDAVRAAMADTRGVLFVLASKSGSTIEPNVLAAEAAARAAARPRPRAGAARRRHHRRRTPCCTAQARARVVSRRLRQPVRHRRPLLGAVALRHGAGRADGRGPRRAARRRARDGRRVPAAALPPRIPASRSAR